MMDSLLGRTLRAKHLLVLALATLGTMSYDLPAAGSVLVGGGIQLVNLRGIERSVARLAGGVSGGLGWLAAAGRYLLLLGSVGFALGLLPLEPVAFALGLGTLVPAAIWHGLDRRALPSGC